MAEQCGILMECFYLIGLTFAERKSQKSSQLFQKQYSATVNSTHNEWWRQCVLNKINYQKQLQCKNLKTQSAFCACSKGNKK
jgi:hypothetical protein